MPICIISEVLSLILACVDAQAFFSFCSLDRFTESKLSEGCALYILFTVIFPGTVSNCHSNID